MKKLGILLAGVFCIQTLFAQNSTFKRTDSQDPIASEAFMVPEAFNSALDSLVYTYYAQHAKKGKCRRPFDENVNYPDSVLRKRLGALPNEVGMPYNSAVRSFIDFYTGRKRRQVENMLGLGKYYFPIFEDILDKNHIPMELKYLPVIESALNTGAISPVGAVGLWQFMPSTGKMYGLEINTLVDERREPIKATQAAAKFLGDLYKIYGDWHLAIAAYNCGPGNVNKAIRRSGGKRDFWEIYPYLPRETRGYVPIFIAANYVMNYYSNHNLCPAEFNMPAYTDTVKITERVSFSDISEVLKMPIEELRILNPQYRKDIIPGDYGTYTLRLPNHLATKFIEHKDSIYARGRSHNKVQQSEDSTGMAAEQEDAPILDRQHKNSKKDRYKDSDDDDRGNRKKDKKKDKKKDSKHRRTSYKVKNGDNLTDIADRYNVSVSDLKKWNGIKGSKIMKGDKIIIKK